MIADRRVSDDLEPVLIAVAFFVRKESYSANK